MNEAMILVSCTDSVYIHLVKTKLLLHLKRIPMLDIYSDVHVVRLQISLYILISGLDNSESVNYDTTKGKNVNSSQLNSETMFYISHLISVSYGHSFLKMGQGVFPGVMSCNIKEGAPWTKRFKQKCRKFIPSRFRHSTRGGGGTQ